MVQFTASVKPSGASQSVTWSLGADECVNQSCGTIDSSGKFTAPASMYPTHIRVRATTASNPNLLAEAVVTMTSPVEDNSNNARFVGQYVLLLGTGFDSALEARQALAATIVASGTGSLSGTCDDPGHSTLSDEIEGGYTVGKDFRASITLGCGAADARTLRVAFAPPADGQPVERGQVIQLGYPDQDLSAGLIVRQNPNAISAASVVGDYAFSLGPLIGRFTLEQDNDFGNNIVKSGQLDVQFGSFTQRNLSFTGEFEVDSNGRGRLVLQGLPSLVIPDPFLPVTLDDLLREFRFYIISKDEIVLLPTFSSTGCCPVNPAVSVGLAQRQSGLPFGNSSLTGSAVLLYTQGLEFLLSRVNFDGAGTFSGSGDRFTGGFDSGGAHEENVPVVGTYSLAPDGLGRGSITINGAETALYLVRPGRAVLGLNSLPALLESQTGGPFSNASLAGDYAVGSTMPPFWGRVTGVLNAQGDGGGSAVLDAFFIGPADGQSAFTIGDEATAYYSTSSDGRTTLNLVDFDGLGWDAVFYLLSPSRAVGIWTHASGTAVLER
ncbi:MAG: hypothetical protein ACRD2Q_02430 [Terriglobales bacterium]